MKLSEVTFKLENNFPELVDILPIINAMTQKGYRAKPNFRFSHQDKLYYFRLNVYPKGSPYPLVALRLYLDSSFNPDDDIYSDFCDANYDDFSLFFSTDEFGTKITVSIYETGTAPNVSLSKIEDISFKTQKKKFYAVCYKDLLKDIIFFLPILNHFIDSNGLLTTRILAADNNNHANLRLYFDKKDNPFSKAPIRLSGVLSKDFPFNEDLSDVIIYSSQNYPIKLDFMTEKVGNLLRFTVYEKK